VTLTYGYDGDSHVTSVADSLGGTVSSFYDSLGNLTSRQLSGTTQARVNYQDSSNGVNSSGPEAGPNLDGYSENEPTSGTDPKVQGDSKGSQSEIDQWRSKVNDLDAVYLPVKILEASQLITSIRKGMQRSDAQSFNPKYGRARSEDRARAQKLLKESESAYAGLKRTPHPTFPGIERIEYQIPALDRTGARTGDFRAVKFEKTVYDPKKVSDTEILQWGKEAAQNAASNGGLTREWSGMARNGIMFRGYLDDKGAVRSFLPDF
jgi:hypothetical protein